MKFAQFIGYNARMFFINHAESDARRLVPDLFVF